MAQIERQLLSEGDVDDLTLIAGGQLVAASLPRNGELQDCAKGAA